MMVETQCQQQLLHVTAKLILKDIMDMAAVQERLRLTKGTPVHQVIQHRLVLERTRVTMSTILFRSWSP